MARRVIGSVLQLFAQINQLAPSRSKASDGTFPSYEHHLRNPGSDHEPHLVLGVGDLICTAGDYTHDPGDGADMDQIAEAIRLSRDPRVKYVIWRDRMFSSYAAHGIPAWTWREYSGDYHGHLHVSVLDAPIADTWTPWRISMSMDLNVDPDFTALIHRVYGIQQMADPIDIKLKDKDGKPRLEDNKLAQAIRTLGEDFAKMNLVLADLHAKVQEVHAMLKGLPDFEPSHVDRETVKLGVQDAFVEGFGPRGVS
jgi:hypothetical protein